MAILTDVQGAAGSSFTVRLFGGGAQATFFPRGGLGCLGSEDPARKAEGSCPASSVTGASERTRGACPRNAQYRFPLEAAVIFVMENNPATTS